MLGLTSLATEGLENRLLILQSRIKQHACTVDYQASYVSDGASGVDQITVVHSLFIQSSSPRDAAAHQQNPAGINWLTAIMLSSNPLEAALS